jgi:hypothetical protein
MGVYLVAALRRCRASTKTLVEGVKYSHFLLESAFHDEVLPFMPIIDDA